MSFKLVTSLLAIIVMITPIFAQEANISKQSESAVGQDTETSSVETDSSPKAKLSGNLQNMVGNGKNRLSGSAELGFSTDFKGWDDERKTSGSQVFLRPRFRINNQYTALLNASFEKGMSQGYQERLGDIRVGVVKRPAIYGKLLVIPNMIATLPTSEMSKRNQDLIMGLEINPNMVYQQSSLLSFFFTPRLRKNFHEYTTTRDDKVNTEYSLTAIGGFLYALTDRFSLQPALIYVQNRSYQGTDRDPNYLVALEGRYQINKNSYALLGTTNGGSIYGAEQGPDSQIEIFDKNTSSFYANYGILF